MTAQQYAIDTVSKHAALPPPPPPPQKLENENIVHLSPLENL